MPSRLLRCRPGPAAGCQVSTPAGVEPAALAALASEVAEEAGELLMSCRDEVAVVQTKSSPTDVVTQADRAAEKLIRERLQAARPGDAILGEEGGETGAGLVRWIVDPLDGTVNFLYGLPSWAVSIAAEVAGVVVAGAVCVPLQRSTFRATLGGGAWLDSGTDSGLQRLACNTGVALRDALVATGFGYPARQRAEQGHVVAAVLPRVRDIRRAGAAAVDLCSVAAGRVDAYYEQGLHDWDIAAGALIAREAGAVTGGLRGEEAGTAMTLAGAPALFAELRELLISLDADRLPPG
jgi:myo-inositol-1(or 4)-monophosphatase